MYELHAYAKFAGPVDRKMRNRNLTWPVALNKMRDM